MNSKHALNRLLDESLIFLLCKNLNFMYNICVLFIIVFRKLIDYLECEESIFIEKDSAVEPVLIGVKDVVTDICEEGSKLQKGMKYMPSSIEKIEQRSIIITII